MSNKVKTISKGIAKEEQKTKSVCFRIDVNLADIGDRTTYMVVTGVPEDLPPEVMPTVSRAAEAQFVSALNDRKFIEFYSLGKSAKDEQPVFYNTSSLAWAQVKNITEVKL